MDFPELIQVQFTDETLDAVCLEDLLHASALEDLHPDEIYFNDHHVFLIVPARRSEGRILHDPPELPGEGQPEDGIVLFLLGRFWVQALWGKIVLEASILALRLLTLLLQNLPSIHVSIWGGITGVPCCGFPIS